MSETFKSPRPVPVLINDSTFSQKKAKKRPVADECLIPRPPVKSAPPISRIFKHSRKHSEGAHAVSFSENGSKLESPELTSPHYNSKSNELYFKQVYKVKSKEDGCYYAIKRSRERFRGDVDRRYKLEEVNKHELLRRNPNCVQFVKAWEESLTNYLESVESIPENEIWNILVDLTLGLKHLHDHNLVHMDIKPANVFIGMDNIYKIGDFGLVLEISKVEITDAQEGDPMYLAPELMQGSFTKAADIFSLGITMLEAACDLDLPRGGDSWHQLRNGQLPEAFIKGLSPDLSKIICWMMHPNPDKRPTVHQILADHKVKEVWRRRKWMYRYSLMSSYAVKLYKYLVVFVLWVVLVFIFPLKPFKRIWSGNKDPISSHDVSIHSDSSSTFSLLEDSHNVSRDSINTPDRSSGMEDSFGEPLVRQPWHREGYCTSPTGLNNTIPTPTSHTKAYNPLIGRLTPPLDTSSPSRGQYTPPSEGRRGRLFEDDGITAKVGVGPKNLLDVFEDAAI